MAVWPPMVMLMLQGGNKHAAKVAARGPQRTRGRAVQTEPVHNVRRFAQRQADDTGNAATCAPSYVEWSGFMAGAQIGDFGFGAYFTDERDFADKAQSESSMTEYTWTPAGTE
jgi:hypothetical protein